MPTPSSLSPHADTWPPPADILTRASLFLDLDGTLLPLVDRPDAVVAGDDLRDLIARLADALPGRLAIVSGRSIAQIDAILGDVARSVMLAGSHGGEFRDRSGTHVTPERPAALADAAALFAAFAATDPRLLIEEKSLGVAAHYRTAPELGGEAVALGEQVAGDLGLVLQHGKMMIEVRAPGDKGTAIRSLMASEAMAGTRPVFLGDDMTDEDGFVVVAEMGGAGVLVGPWRQTAASYHLDDVDAVHAWLNEALRRMA